MTVKITLNTNWVQILIAVALAFASSFVAVSIVPDEEADFKVVSS